MHDANWDEDDVEVGKNCSTPDRIFIKASVSDDAFDADEPSSRSLRLRQHAVRGWHQRESSLPVA